MALISSFLPHLDDQDIFPYVEVSACNKSNAVQTAIIHACRVEI